MRVFVYGPLRFPEVMQLVSDRKYRAVNAVLKGFSCRRFDDQPYPGVVCQEAAETPGVMIDDVDLASMQRLDAFVGDRYIRQNMMVKNDMGRSMLAAVYLTRPDSCRALSEETWDAEAFRKEQLQTYVDGLRKGQSA